MFKLGVCRLDQFRKPGSILSRNRIAFHLLLEAKAEERVRLYECVMPQIRLSNGVYRTTSRARFRGFDEFVDTELSRHFEASRALDIHDWAASDCIASAEWAEALWSHFPNARVTASDLALYLIEAALPDGNTFICEAGGEVLQYVRPPFVVRLSPPEHRLMLVNRILAWNGRRKIESLRQRWGVVEKWLRADGAEPLNLPPFVLRRIPLIHPDAEALCGRSEGFAIAMHSAFEPLTQPCDVIRTMNFFNLLYFGEDKLREGIEAVRASLKPGGIWIVGRTVKENPPEHHASMWIKDGQEFRLLSRYGNGSEVDPLIAAKGR